MLGREVEVHAPRGVAPGTARRGADGPVLAFRRWTRPTEPRRLLRTATRRRRAPPRRRPRPSSLRRILLCASAATARARPTSSPAALGASRTGVLQQLRALEDDPPRQPPDRAPRGRPAAPPVRRHRRTPRSSSRPTTTGWRPGCCGDRRGRRRRARRAGLRGPPAPDRRPRPARAGRARRRRTRPLVERVRELAVIQDEQGYLADAIVEPDGTIRLREHNCAIFDVARGQHGGRARRSSSCSARSSGADVVRETHIASGDRCCSYRIVGRARTEPDRRVPA